MTAILYMATNRINGKRYIGYTAISLDYRRRGHLKQAKYGRKSRFACAIRKYGDHVFDWVELCRVETPEKAKIKEIELIALLRPEYNVTAGGDGSLGVKAWNRRAVICLNDGKIFASQKEAETFYNLHAGSVSWSISRHINSKGLHFEFYDKELSENERHSRIKERLQETVKRRRQRTDHPIGRQPIRNTDAIGRNMSGPMSRARRVVCLDDNEEYESASAASVAYAISKSGIIELCLGKRGRKTIGGKKFAYMDIVQ